MAKAGLMSVITWIVGILVSLAVGSGMINGILGIPGIPAVVVVIGGWIVVIGAVISLIMAVFGR